MTFDVQKGMVQRRNKTIRAQVRPIGDGRCKDINIVLEGKSGDEQLIGLVLEEAD
jgi:hypothetical protein